MTTRQLLTSAWDWNPVVIAACLLALLAYALALRFRGPARGGYFVTAVALFFLTLASPLNALADGYLFSAHMAQHLLLLLVIPPLLLLGLPEWKAGQDGVSSRGRRSRAEPLPAPPQLSPTESSSKTESARPRQGGHRLHPLVAWLAGLTAMWVWHERTLCDAATTVAAVRVVQILSLIALGLVFWWPIVGPQPERRLAPLLGVLYLFSACVGCTVLGILITFAPVGVVCPVYLHPVDRLGILPLIRQRWGITPAIDQQAGGLMMWVPACGIYLCGVIALLARWYRAGEERPAEPGAKDAGATGGLPAAGATGGTP
jgi:putative membrane protein